MIRIAAKALANDSAITIARFRPSLEPFYAMGKVLLVHISGGFSGSFGWVILEGMNKEGDKCHKSK